MADVKDMYKMTRFVDSSHYYKKFNADHHKTLVEARDNLAKLYANKYRYLRIDQITALKLINRTESNGYIRILKDDEGAAFDITDKGHHLIGKSWYFFRVGLWDESLKKYDKIQTVLVILVVAIISATGGIIFNMLLGSKS